MKLIDVLKSADCDIHIFDSNEKLIYEISRNNLSNYNSYLNKRLLKSEVMKMTEIVKNNDMLAIFLVINTEK